MTTEYRTVLISADCTCRFEAAVETGAELARVLQLTLAGLFVEEEALLDLSSFPFTRAISIGHGGAQPMDPRAMRLALEREGRRLRAELVRRAEEADLSWRFDIGRGRTSEAIGKAAQVGDIVVLPTLLTEGGVSARMETARVLLGQGHAALLTPERRPMPNGPIVALIETPGQGATIALAARIASRLGARLVVHAWPRAEADMRAIERRLEEMAAELPGVDLNVLGFGERFNAQTLGPTAPRLIVSKLAVSDRLELAGPSAPLRTSGSGLLLLPDGPPAAD